MSPCRLTDQSSKVLDAERNAQVSHLDQVGEGIRVLAALYRLLL